MDIAIALVVGYLLGAIPVGLLVGRLARGIDIRHYGSGKTGATNVLRTLGVKYTVLVVLADMGKGAAAVAIALAIADSDGAETAAGLGSLAGHIWPFYAGFRGGRGVLTGLGGFFVVHPIICATAVATGIATIVLSRYVSAGSIVGTVIVMLFAIALRVTGDLSMEHTIWALVGGPLVLLWHRDNMVRIVKGTERRLGQAGEKRLHLHRTEGQP